MPIEITEQIRARINNNIPEVSKVSVEIANLNEQLNSLEAQLLEAKDTAMRDQIRDQMIPLEKEADALTLGAIALTELHEPS